VTARIYVGDDVRALSPAASYPLPAPAARHVAQALRMRTGESLVLFTGAGGEYDATIEAIDRREVVVRVGRHRAIERENARPVALVQALIAGDMMDFVVRKAVELGVASIVPVRAARSQGVPGERIAKRVEHWRQIVIAACEQCGRNRIPPVADVVSLAHWLASSAPENSVVLEASAARSLATIAVEAPPGAIVCGPEGGFSPEELAAANARGMVAAHLGPRVLRAETAPLAALATLNALAGN
jgi:16S rRNA (uracil1498-N3)-methyltransferase